MEQKKQPWQGIGVEVDGNLSSREMLYKAKLDWEVSKIPSQRPKSYGNQELLRYFKGFFDAGEAHMETVGGLDDARIIWSLGRLDEDFTLDGEDVVRGYLLLASRKESREKIDVQFNIVRESCYNMLQIPTNTKSHVKNIFRRTFKPAFPFLNQKPQKFDDEMNVKVNAMIVTGREAISNFAQDARRLADKKVDEATAWRYLIEVFQPDLDVSKAGDSDLPGLADDHTKLARKAFSDAPGQDLVSAKMTAWGLLNSVTYTVDHQLGKTQDSRLRQAWFGPNGKLKKRAMELALAL